MPGSIASFSRLSNELLDIRHETRWVEGENLNAPFPVPPFGKGGSGGISEAVENPPKSPFKKGDFKESTRQGRVMIAATPEITRSGLVFAAAQLFPSVDNHHEMES